MAAVDRYTSFDAKFAALQAMQAAETSEGKLQLVTEERAPLVDSDITAAHISQYQRQQRRTTTKPPESDSRRGHKLVSCKTNGAMNGIKLPTHSSRTRPGTRPVEPVLSLPVPRKGERAVTAKRLTTSLVCVEASATHR